ncbi:hypothetical protein ACWGB8_19285 [Kitasatospora sp. NPDC054939]
MTFEEPEDLTVESVLTADEAAEMADLMSDLLGMMLSVTVEGDPATAGRAEDLALRIRTALDETDCRIQVEDGGRSAVLGPTRLDAHDPQAALDRATAALGGTAWTAPVTTDTAMGPVLHTTCPVLDGPDEAGAATVHLWAGCAYAFLTYAEDVEAAAGDEPAPAPATG